MTNVLAKEQPTLPYRKYVARAGEGGLYDVYCEEPDGFALKLRTSVEKEFAELIAVEFTDIERRAQLAREAESTPVAFQNPNSLKGNP